MSDTHYFTASEVDALIPQLENIFSHVDMVRARAEDLAGQSLKGLRSSEPADVAQAQMARSQVEFLMQAVEDDIHQIHTLGGIVKDVEAGLVDFLGDLRGRDVWLCWKRGETKVGYWHSLEGGFSQRNPLPQTSRKSRLH